jgi:hypothetical protein
VSVDALRAELLVIALSIVAAVALYVRAMLRLRNVTTSTTVIEGGYGFGAANAGLFCRLVTHFTANGTDEYEIQYYTSSGRPLNGLGLALNEGGVERYQSLYLEKIG